MNELQSKKKSKISENKLKKTEYKPYEESLQPIACINILKLHCLCSMETKSFLSLPFEIQCEVLLLTNNISDVLNFSQAMNNQNLNQVLNMKHRWRTASVGPRVSDQCLQYLGDHTEKLSVLGSVQFDKRNRPKKTKFFKTKELLPKKVITKSHESCINLKILHLKKCVLGPHLNNSLLPPGLEILIIESCVFVKKSSFFTNIWTNLKNLRELRVEDIQNFDKDDCYAVIESAKIDFDISFSHGRCSFNFIRTKL